MAFFGRPKPSEVFTPRRSDVNSEMYVVRPELERLLKRATNGTQHIIVFGDSGSGKTWLYKKIFKENANRYKVVDLSIAVSKGLSAALEDAAPQQEWEPMRMSEGKSLDAHLVIATPTETRTIESERRKPEALAALLADLSKGKGASFIVFDNFEQISREDEALKEICSLIVRLDNPNFAQYGVRFLFVGVRADMKEMIARYDNAGTVTNRLTEIPPVTPLSLEEASELITKGLKEKLKITIFDEKELISRICFVTCRNAQQIHELCYQVACEAEENGWEISKENYDRAERDWVDTSLAQHVAFVESRMNKRDTKIQRRNQVLYCIGALDTDEYRANNIAAMVRKLFSKTAGAQGLGVDQILSGLSEGINPILIRNPNDSSYRLAHPKLRLAIRSRLEHLAPAKEKVTSVEFMKSLEALLIAIKSSGPGPKA